jgi:hypothetical protein
MTQASRNVAVYAKSQSAIGTGATIAQNADNAIRVRSCEFAQSGEGLQERADSVSPFGLPAPPLVGSRYWTITITADVQPFTDYTAVAASPLAPLIRACSVVEAVTYDGDDAIRLSFPSTINPSVTPCTIERHEIDGDRYRAVDCKGTMRLIGDAAGRLLTWEFTLEGRWQDVAASAFTAAATSYGNAAADPLPLTFCGAALTSAIRRSNGSTEATITGLEKFAVTPNTIVTARPDSTALAFACYADSFLSRGPDGDEITFTCDNGPEDDNADGLRKWATWLAQARGRDLTMTMNQGASGHRVDVVMDEAHYRTPAPNEGKEYRQCDLIVRNAQGETPTPVLIYMLAGS